MKARTEASVFSGAVLAIVFGFLWLGVQTVELWSPAWAVEEGREAPITLRLPANYFRITMLRNEFHYLSTSSSSCPRLVARGTFLEKGKECTGLVKAYESSRRPPSPLRLLGYLALYIVLGLLLGTGMRKEGSSRARHLRTQVTVFGVLGLLAIGSKAILLLTPLPAQALPTAVAALLAAYFVGRRLGMVVALIAALFVSSLLNFDIEILLFHLAVGVASVVVLGPRRRARYQLKAGAMAAWIAVLVTAATTLLFSGTLDIHDDLYEHVDPRHSLWIASLFSGLGSGVAAWILTPLVAALVGEVSRGRLLDLQDLDHPLLERVRERAPGTWEHSRAMANLAEAAAHAIGGNALLVRVGSYFHDIGKSSRPDFFIENQGGGPNPHDGLTPHESARAIFQHVSDGVRLLRQEGVPEDVVEFAYSHHGSSLLEFFWHKNLSDGNSLGLSEKDFVYPGHRPSTRETGILMLVDAVEAAARTVDEPDRDKFEALVQRIVFFKLSQGQLDESGLSLADLHKVTATIVDTLSNMYHARIKYPWQTESTGAIASQTPPEGQEPPAPAPEPPAPAPEPSPETEAPQPEPSAPSPAPEPTPDTYTGPAPAPPRNTLPAHGKPPEDES